MRTFIARFDANFCVLHAEDLNDVEKKLIDFDPLTVRKDGKLKYNWESHFEDIDIEDVTDKDGIFFFGSFG